MYSKLLKFLFLIVFILFYSSCQKEKPQDHSKLFFKSITVFDLDILATNSTADEKIIHAAKIMAQYLDNDEDGVVDNKLVHDMLISRKATLVMFNNEYEAESAWRSGKYDFPENAQALFDEETIPSFDKNSTNRRFDATLEEVLHLITHEGFSQVYDELREVRGSLIANAMDIARGGYFLNPPSQYPLNAWYSYDDITCTYDCMIVEYFYWALTSILGAQAYPGRFDEIGHEWKLNTLEKIRSGDILIYSLMTDSKFNLPKVLPDNNYNAINFVIKLNK